MKKILTFITVVVCALSCAILFSSCIGAASTCASHTDINSDGMCDTCGTAYSCPGHADANSDGMCDFCLAEFFCPGHTDVDENGKCDVCVAPFVCPGHADLDFDNICDNCQAAFDCVAHSDANRDGKCDNCKTPFVCPGHVDADTNGKCDVCKAIYFCEGHIDSNGDKKCDSCKAAFTCPCSADTNGDERCDICNSPFLCVGHKDSDTNGKCDNCGASYTPPKDYRPDFIEAVNATKPEKITLSIKNDFGADGVLESSYVITFAEDGSFVITGEAKSFNTSFVGDYIIAIPVNVVYDASSGTYSDDGAFAGENPVATGLTLNLSALSSYESTETTLSAVVAQSKTASVLGASYSSDVAMLVTKDEGKIVSLSLAYGNSEIVCIYA